MADVAVDVADRVETRDQDALLLRPLRGIDDVVPAKLVRARSQWAVAQWLVTPEPAGAYQSIRFAAVMYCIIVTKKTISL